jgi:ABC-type antimicrobial peptide transport system permease subunit
MNFWNGLVNGMREVWAHKFRSLLSMSGIILGVAALVAMVGVVQGMMIQFRETFESSGGILKLEVNDQEPPIEQKARAFLSPGRTMEDALALERAIPLARYVVPQTSVNWKEVRSGTSRIWTRITGAVPSLQQMDRYELKAGRFISDLDIRERSPVIVLSGWRAGQVFDAGVDPLGQQVLIDGMAFTVVGVTSVGRSDPWWKRINSIIPITVVHSRFTGDTKLSNLGIQIYDAEDIDDVVAQIENVLLRTHNGIRDFAVETKEEQLAEFRATERSFTFSLGSVAGITLIVGGIGIMNVMLAVINERIREIGVRKAVGARDIDIFIQFVAESILISTIGGILGIFLSVGLVDVLQSVLPEDKGTVVLSPEAMAAGFAFSMVTGVIAGLYPAFKAARLDVIDALRYE